MPLFGKNATELKRSHKEPQASHRLTLDVARAENLAAMLAHSRASGVVDVADLVAGMYLYGWERLSRYWDSENQEKVEGSLRKMCRISPQRWNYWIEVYDKNRKTKEAVTGLAQILRKFQKTPPTEPLPKRSMELANLFKQAETIAPLRDTSEGRDIPILTSECILLCVVRNRSTEISRMLAASGMNLQQLEKDALSSRRAPRA